MSNLSLVVKQLKNERAEQLDRVQQLDKVVSLLSRINGPEDEEEEEGPEVPAIRKPAGSVRHMSISARRKIAKAQKDRWRKFHAKQKKAAA